jgi:hypothetical protein
MNPPIDILRIAAEASSHAAIRVQNALMANHSPASAVELEEARVAQDVALCNLQAARGLACSIATLTAIRSECS